MLIEEVELIAWCRVLSLRCVKCAKAPQEELVSEQSSELDEAPKNAAGGGRLDGKSCFECVDNTTCDTGSLAALGARWGTEPGSAFLAASLDIK